MTGHVHLHAAGDVAGLPAGTCATVCGLPCGTRETTAYSGLDPERVTCPDCLAGSAPATRRDAAGPYRGSFALYRGKLAYLDTFAGLVPCKVTAVGEDLAVTVRVTAARRGYDRGEILTGQRAGVAVIPRTAVYLRGGQYRISSAPVVAIPDSAMGGAS